MQKIFISCSSKDSKAALTICDAIEARGYACWISSRDIDPGENFQEAIVRAIRRAPLMILVFSANANNSSEIKKEIALASQNRVTVIPMRIEDAMPSDALAYEFSTRQWIDVFGDWERAMKQLLGHIARALPQEEQVAVDAPKPAAVERKSVSGRKYLPYAAGAALVLGVVAWGYSSFPASKPPIPAPEPAASTEPAAGKDAQNAPAADALEKGNTELKSKNYGAAMQWFQKAAALGNADAQIAVGSLYADGLGVTKDDAQAEQWFLKAAAQGNSDAESHLGILYESAGMYTDAMKWFQKAADQGNAGAENGVGGIYYNGFGVATDYGQAMQWFQKSAAQNNNSAEFAIGVLYEYGRGVTKDYDQAIQWYQKSAAHGNQFAQQAIDKIKTLQAAK